MQFWLKCSIAVAIAGLASGCASPEDTVINEDHQYVNVADRAPLKLPQGVNRPQGNAEYVLPEVKVGGEVGEDLDIQSPPQLFTLASGSRLDNDNKVNKIWFDKTTAVSDLPNFTFDVLQEFLNYSEVKGSEINSARKTAKTGWLNQSREGGFWSWGDEARTLGYRFETKQQSTRSGSSTTVEVKLIGHQVNGKDVPLTSLTQAFIERAEISFLNDYIFHFQLMQEELMRKAKVISERDFSLALAEAESGQWGFHSAKNADTVWGSLRPLLEEVGFKIDDVNRSSKTLYVTFEEQDQGFWSSLWSDDAFNVSLAPGQYVIKVVSDEQRQSNILFFDNNEQALDRSIVRSMEEVLIKTGRKLDLEL